MSDLILDRVQAPLRRQRRINLPPVGASLALLFLAALLLAALFPQLFTHVDPLAIVPRDAFQAPSWAHWLGTDQSGRDIFARIIHGARQSLLIGVAATALSMTIAISLGLLGGLGGARVDRAVGWLLEVLFAFPSLILALLFVAVFGSGVGTLIVATGLGVRPVTRAWCAARCWRCATPATSKRRARSAIPPRGLCCANCCPMPCAHWW